MKPPKPDIRATLKRLDLTYSDLAALLGVSTAAVGRWAAGRSSSS
jgi:transcriptional regulator with XRE-family HTH domain